MPKSKRRGRKGTKPPPPPLLPIKIKQEPAIEDVPPALQNIKTEVKVEDIEYVPPNNNYPHVPNISPLVHAADGRSKCTIVDSSRPFRIPPHLLGRNLNDPMADVVPGTRRQLQKPRLGVRIPYRNLTSQIVTHEELSRELMERSKRNNPNYEGASDLSESSNGYFFTLKIMARLAHRLPNAHFPDLTRGKQPVPASSLPGSSATKNLDQDIERAIALKQLQELPPKCPADVKSTAKPGIDFKKIPLKSGVMTAQQLALKQLKEIQIRKPKVGHEQREEKTPIINLTPDLKTMQLKLSMAHQRACMELQKAAAAAAAPTPPAKASKRKAAASNSPPQKCRVSPRKKQAMSN